MARSRSGTHLVAVEPANHAGRDGVGHLDDVPVVDQPHQWRTTGAVDHGASSEDVGQGTRPGLP